MAQGISRQLLDRLIAEARQSSRRRKNHNFHADYAEPCQRLIIAMEPDSYVQPHRHLTPLKPETFVVLRGAMLLFIFDDNGVINESFLLRPGGDMLGADIPAGVWHSILALESGSVFFETKPGPYHQIDDKDWAPWAPAEGSPDSAAWLQELHRRGMEGRGA
jgi:cupin fold WbuC family metalloprotein